MRKVHYSVCNSFVPCSCAAVSCRGCQKKVKCVRHLGALTSPSHSGAAPSHRITMTAEFFCLFSLSLSLTRMEISVFESFASLPPARERAYAALRGHDSQDEGEEEEEEERTDGGGGAGGAGRLAVYTVLTGDLKNYNIHFLMQVWNRKCLPSASETVWSMSEGRTCPCGVQNASSSVNY